MTHSVLLQRDPSKGWGSELGVAVTVTPGSTPCPDGFVVHLPAQQKLVEHFLGTDSCGVLLVLLSLERNALKRRCNVHDQVLHIMRIHTELKLVMRPTTVPLGR